MKKIAIDIDNTICETNKFYSKLALYYDREVLHKNSYFDFNEVVPLSPDWTKEELMNFIRDYFNKENINIPIKENAPLYINKLKDLGYTIIFLTARGRLKEDHSDLVIGDYLKKHNIKYDQIIAKAEEKYLYLNDCNFFIDDSIKKCEEALNHSNCKVIMMSTNSTENYINDKLIKVNNWEEIYNYINSF